MKNQEDRTYLRRCRRCSQFMNWRLLPSGVAICLECGCEHDPLPAPNETAEEILDRLKKKD